MRVAAALLVVLVLAGCNGDHSADKGATSPGDGKAGPTPLGATPSSGAGPNTDAAGTSPGQSGSPAGSPPSACTEPTLPDPPLPSLSRKGTALPVEAEAGAPFTGAGLSLDHLQGGGAYFVARAGDLAYFAEGNLVDVVDVKDARAPRLVGQSPALPGIVMSIALANGHAFVGLQNYGLLVLSLADPVAPVAVGSLRVCAPHFVAVEGTTAYLACGRDGLSLVDLSDPKAPRLLGQVAVPGFAEAVAVVQSIAYVAAHEAGLRVVSVHMPSAPVEIGSYDTAGDAWHVAVAGNHAYVADHQREPGPTGALRIIDVTVPAIPLEVGSFVTYDGVHGVAVDGGIAYIARDSGRFSVLDVTDPSSPSEIAQMRVVGEALKVQLSGPTALVPTSSGELYVFDVSASAAPVELARWSSFGQPVTLAAVGTVAVAGIRDRGVQVLDLTSSPPTTAEVRLVDQVLDVALDCGWAVAVTGPAPWAHTHSTSAGAIPSTAVVLDVAELGHPRVLGNYSSANGPQAVAMAGRLAYLGLHHGGMQVVDFTDPANPRVRGLQESTPPASSLAVNGHRLYVAGAGTLKILDVADPDAPIVVGTYDTPGEALGVAVHGTLAFIADGTGGLLVLDVSDPARPTQLDVWDAAGSAVGVAVANGHVAVADAGTWAGLVVFSEDQGRLTEVGRMEGLVYAQDVAATDRILFAGLDNGLAMARLA